MQARATVPYKVILNIYSYKTRTTLDIIECLVMYGSFSLIDFTVLSANSGEEAIDSQDLNKEEEEPIDDVEEEEIMDDEEEMEIPSPEDGSPGHFVIKGEPVVSSPPQMVSDWEYSMLSRNKIFDI